MTITEFTEEQKNLVRQFDGDIEGLVAAASEMSSPLHDLFDWSGTDLAAADQRRVRAEELLAEAKVGSTVAETIAEAESEAAADDENTDAGKAADTPAAEESQQ